MATSNIIVVGSHAPALFLRVRRLPQPGETVIGWDFQEPQDGGKGSNQAIAAARLGGRVAFVGCVGRDRIGDEGERWLAEAGIDTRWLRRHETVGSGVGFILLDEQGMPAMVTAMGANAEIGDDDVDAALRAHPGAGVMLTQFEIPVERALAAADRARTLGMTTIVNPAPAPNGFPPGVEAAAILVPNETEALALLGLESNTHYDPEWLAAELRRRSHIDTILITLGAKGIVGLDVAGVWQVQAPQIQAVDTSGAGDVFCAALAVCLMDGMDVRRASNWACAAASLSVTRAGTIPSFPMRAEVTSFLYKDS